MKLYQPVLFVGLGGSGCDIGAVVERRLREEICGPDGTDFLDAKNDAGMLPYQLPQCVQFVYADLNQLELDRMPRRVVLSPQHVPAVNLTAHYSRDLAPTVHTYQQLAMNLRLEAGAETSGWLPPELGEPRVTPLSKGAGQLPTIGRAALFGTFLSSLAPALRDLSAAVGKLATSGRDLAVLGGRAPQSVDVFVAFSVAGGTGAGIFYDYLHLIGYVFGQANLRAKVYPLVLMPSAFAEGFGGGRYAQLNAGRALLDLFRLIDHQNAGAAETQLHDELDRGPVKPYEQAVRYPGTGRIVLLPGTVQTGFLFSQPIGADRADLHRSIGSLVLSLIGTEFEPAQAESGEAPHSFAEWWINAGNDRQVQAENGIGNRGVSTALVASLTVPFDDLAGIIGGRLLREAINQMCAPNGKVESNQEHIGAFVGSAGVHPVLTREGVPFAEPEPGHGAKNVARALNERAEAMQNGITALDGRLSHEMTRHVDNFEPRRAIREQLARHDIFRVQRIGFGHPDLEQAIDEAGASGLLRNRRLPPPPPDGIDEVPPTASVLKNRRTGRLRWTDPPVVAVRQRQNEWYKWQNHVTWAKHWHAHAARWQRTLTDSETEMAALTKALLEFAHNDEARYEVRVGELYRHRVGVSYLLPLGGTTMEQFYLQVRNRLIQDLVADQKLPPAATEAGLVHALIATSGGWADAFTTSLDRHPEQAVNDLRDLVKENVKTCLRDVTGGRSPLLPRLHDLLAEVAGRHGASNPVRDNADDFRNNLAGLVPAAFTPQGNGPMKVLISYPADKQNPAIENYLREWLNLQVTPDTVYDMRPTLAESITVVLFRSSMGVTEVGEVRDVLRLWAKAISKPERAYFLRWRQRTGYAYGYLATTAEHRVEILHRLLCALWNGKIRADGDSKSPDSVKVEFGGGVTMNLRLSPLEQASSWASLLRAYELWALDDDDTRRRICRQLMREYPEGLDSDYDDPDPLFSEMVELADEQTKLLEEKIDELGPRDSGRAQQMHEFWAVTLPAALDRLFTDIESPAKPNLRQLQLAAARRRAA
ncbi:MAG TPA: tubulin-like doman-containing protein [Streptosporangiaceae bacterium]|nr:tubulin-like doman-containing protein [Streptosporangiaceae bacterium]